MTPARWIALVALVALAIFALQGGNFSERNYLALLRTEDSATRRVKELQHDVDSLRAFRDSLAANPAVQERVAREKFGMLRPGEMTFTIIWDSTPAKRP
ncbi:MAG: FtsB family cell division protein [Gemmatimonadales bacterium]